MMATHADIDGNLVIGALQSVRRNSLNTAFEAYTAETSIPYLVYSALVSQSGTAAPTATVLQNTLGFEVAWSRSSIGQYSMELVGSSFPITTMILTSATRSIGVGGVSLIYGGVSSDQRTIDIVTGGIAVGPPVTSAQYDGILINAPIEIRIYLSRLPAGARAAGTATVRGTLTGTAGATSIFAAAYGTALVVATLSGRMAGAAVGTATVRGTLSGGLRGAVSGTATVTGTLIGRMSGAAWGTATLRATLRTGSTFGTASGTVTVRGTLTG